jgi:four helix bundle protein
MPEPLRSYRELDVWRKAMDLVQAVYRARGAFPTEERFGLVNQIRRSAVSIPSNIAEGHARGASGEFQRFLSISMGSVAELETQIILSRGLGYLAASASDGLLRELDTIGKMLRGLRKSLPNRKLRQM